MIAEAFGSLASNIYHVGSIAFPEMIAKSVLDTNVELAPGVEIASAKSHHLYVCPHHSAELAGMLLERKNTGAAVLIYQTWKGQL